MVVSRGEIWWADLPDPTGSGPGYRRPVLVVQADTFNRSRLPTVVIVSLTSNLALVDMPGNILITSRQSKLPKDSVAVLSQISSVDRSFLEQRVAKLPSNVMHAVDEALRLVLALAT